MSTIVKITELPAATSPVSPTDVTAIVQSGVTKKSRINQFGYLAAGSGAQTRTIDSKLQETISVKDFGAVGDGVADDGPALQAAITAAAGKTLYIPQGTYYYTSLLNIDSAMTIMGDGYTSQLKPNTPSGNNIRINASNVLIEKIRMQGTSPGGFAIGYPGAGVVKNVTFQNCAFLDIGQAVWIWTANDITVQSCLFDSVLYGVIQQAGYASSFVLVDNCIARNMKADFVQANCESGAPSEAWTITNNMFEGSISYPSTATEQRFVGTTSVKNVIISGNNVQKCAGDAAIHCENTLGNTIISNNIFDNCQVSGGNDGYIYLLNTAEHCVVEGNMFFRTDTSLQTASALSTRSGSYALEIVFANNRIVGNGPTGNLKGISSAFDSGAYTIANNYFKNLINALEVNATYNVIFNGNWVVGCKDGIYYDVGPSGGSLENYSVCNNFFQGTTGTNDIIARTNTNGTNPPKNWNISGNIFSKEVRWGDSAAGGANQATGLSLTCNVFNSGATFALQGSPARIISFGNSFQSAGVATVPTANYLPDYANDAAAAAGNVPIGGMYRNGSVVQVRVS